VAQDLSSQASALEQAMEELINQSRVA